jgi:hypothetical protein
MTPEEKFELMQMLLERGIEVKTYYKPRRITAIERTDNQVVLHYEDGSTDKMHIRDFGRQHFVAVII